VQSPTIVQVQAASADLALSITNLVQNFESANPGVVVHSLPVFPATKSGLATVHVKVQIG
jgi:hypothetical protein